MSLTIAMDLTKSDSFVKAYTARQGEFGDTINLTFYENGAPIGISDISSAKVKCETPVGHYIEKQLRFINDKLVCDIDKNMNSESGYFRRFYFEVKRSSTQKTLTSPDLIYFVIPDAKISGSNANDYISRVEILIDEIEDKYNKYVSDIDEKYRDEIIRLNKLFDKIQTQLENELTEFKTTIRNKYNELQGQVSQLEDSISELLDRMVDLVDTVSGRVDDLKLVVDDLEAKLNKALQDFEKGNFYTKSESDTRFAKKTDLTKDNVGLGNVDNYGTATQADAETGKTDNKFMTPLRTKQHVDTRIATQEEIIVGERDDVIVTPKALKEATESTIPFKEWFATGKETQNISGTRDASFVIGASMGVSPNGEGKRPYTVNSDGTLTLTRPTKLKITMTHKIVSGTSTPSLYHYVYIADVASLPSGFTGDDLEISSTGSTLATNGTLNYNWINSGTRVWDLPKGFVIKPTVRIQDANKAVRWIQLLGMTIEEVPAPNTKGLNISALADNPVIRLDDVKLLLDAERTKRGQHMVWGENHQIQDPATPNFGDFYASTNHEYKSIPESENYLRYDSKGLIIVEKDGYYKISANVKRQWRVSVALWHYVSLMVNSGGTLTKWDFSPFGGTTQNRNRQKCQLLINLKAGDTIYFKSESNNNTNALQFINIDQFCMERLGD